MADNVTSNLGSGGPVFATDDIAGVHHPYTKLEFGDADVATRVSTSNPLPVDLRVDNLATALDVNIASQVAALTVDLGANNDVTVQGEDAENAPVTAAPVLVGGRYDAIDRVLGDGDAGSIALDAAGRIKITDGGGSITVDGTVTANAGSGVFVVDGSAVTQPISAASLPLPSGAATAARQDTGNTSLSSIETNTTDIPSIVGTDGLAGPAKALSVAGTESGGTLREIRVDANGRLQVDVVTPPSDTPISGTVTANLGTTDTGNLAAIKTAVELIDNAISGTEMQVDVVAPLPAGTNAIGKLAANAGVNIGDIGVTSIAAGSNLIGDVGVGVRTSGGTTIFRSLDVDETSEQVKASAGQLYWLHCMNLTASVLYLKFYDNAAPTVGTTAPVLTFPIPTTGDTNGAGFTLSIPQGIAFSTAISVAVTTGIADTDTGAPATNACVLNLGYA